MTHVSIMTLRCIVSEIHTDRQAKYIYRLIFHKKMIKIEEYLPSKSALYTLPCCGGYFKSYIARLILVVESSFFHKWKLDQELYWAEPTFRILSRAVFFQKIGLTVLRNNSKKTVLDRTLDVGSAQHNLWSSFYF